jgi:hypothetical protein
MVAFNVLDSTTTQSQALSVKGSSQPLRQFAERLDVTKITHTNDLDRVNYLALKTYSKGLNFSRVINREHTTDRWSLSRAVGFFVRYFIV